MILRDSLPTGEDRAHRLPVLHGGWERGTPDANPNGSISNIAGVLSEGHNVPAV